MNLTVIDPALITTLRNAEYTDAQIADMSAKELFEAWCRWEGLLGTYPEAIWKIVRQLQHQETLAQLSQLLSTHRPVGQAEFLEQIKADESRFNAGCLTSYSEPSDQTYWSVGKHHVGISSGRVGESKGFFLPLDA